MTLQSKKNCIRLVFISIFLIGMLQGCATKKSDIPDSKAKEDQVGAKRFKESQGIFALRNPMMLSNIGDLELIVRMATMAEIPEGLYKTWVFFPAEGAGSLALGLVAPPFYASGLVVGGVFLIPLGTYGYLHDKNECIKFLTEKKRCEIVAVRDTEEKWQSELLSDSRYSSIRDLYKKWHKEIGKGDAASVIQKIGRALNTDGVLVVRLKERKPWGAVYGILNIALMDIPLFYRLISPDIGAWIYETATGQLVWSQEHSIFGDDPSKISNSLVSLFAELENAVPRQLIK